MGQVRGAEGCDFQIRLTRRQEQWAKNNKLDTVHRSNEKLEGTLREVLEQLSMPDDMQAALLEGELGVESRAGRKLAMEERVVPAAKRLATAEEEELQHCGMSIVAHLAAANPKNRYVLMEEELLPPLLSLCRPRGLGLGLRLGFRVRL